MKFGTVIVKGTPKRCGYGDIKRVFFFGGFLKNSMLYVKCYIPFCQCLYINRMEWKLSLRLFFLNPEIDKVLTKVTEVM